MINKFICKVIKHDLITGGSCPFTGKVYMYCKRCNDMIPVGKTKDYSNEKK
jgi:hypothetical protein